MKAAGARTSSTAAVVAGALRAALEAETRREEDIYEEKVDQLGEDGEG
jgi:hypothetical protein